MTHQDESANADANRVVPSTRRSRRDGEREAELRALYADAPQPSSMRVVDGGAPMYRTRREMRESASRLARDLPVIVEPLLAQSADAPAEAPIAAGTPAAEAPVDEAPAAQATPSGRRARRVAAATQPATAARETTVEPAAEQREPLAQSSRRARRIAAASVPAVAEPDATPAPTVASAPVGVSTPSPEAPHRSGRAAGSTAAWSDLVASAPQVDAVADERPVQHHEVAEPASVAQVEEAPVDVEQAPTSEVEQPVAETPAPTASEPTEAALVHVAPHVAAAPEADAAEDVEPIDEMAPVDEPAIAASASAPSVTDVERVMTRSERRAAQAASSDEVSAAVAAVLGGEQEDVASTPVRSPLRREARPPKPATTMARRPVAHAPVVRPSRRARTGAARKAMQRLAAAGVILSIGSFVAVTSLPAQAFSPSEEASTTGAYGDVEVEQQLDVTTGGGAHGAEEVTAILTRDDFGVDDALASARITPEELASLQAVADAEDIGPYYGGDPAMPEVWAQLETSYTQSPFPSLAEVPVSSGFGYRWGSFHGGVDLVPGAGTPVFPVANGVVIATWQGNNPGGGGYEVIVEHNIDGQYFQSWYPHMQAGSIQVEPGQVVDVNTQLGAVGSTGRSTGAHLHLEIKNGDYTSVDPLVWLATREQILEP